MAFLERGLSCRRGGASSNTLFVGVFQESARETRSEDEKSSSESADGLKQEAPRNKQP